MRTPAFKKIACFLSFFLITCFFSNVECSAANNAEAEGNSSNVLLNEPVTLSYYCPLPSDTAGVINDLSETEIYKELEKRTNVHIAFIHPPADVQLEKFNLMMAAGDMPDIAELPWSRYPGMLDRAAEVGALLNLDSLIEKHAPNLNEILRENDEVRWQVTADDGHIYRFPGLSLIENSVEYGPFIRGDLLKKLGLAVPETMDEWEMVLKMFRDHKVCSTPLSFDMTVLSNSRSFMGAFGIAMEFFLEDGSVAYGPIENSYKDFLATFNRWYTNGLIDREFPVLKDTQANNKIAGGEAGAFIGTAKDMGNALSALEAIDAGYELIAVKNPVLHRGDKLAMVSRAWEVNPAGGAVISSRNRHPAETVKWLDYAYGEAGHRLFNFGIEGKTYTMENGRPEFTDLILNNPDGLSIGQAMSRYLRTAPAAPGYRTDESTVAGYKYQEQKDAVELWSGNLDGRLGRLMPPVSLTREENVEISGIMKDVTTYTNEMFLKYVLGAESLDSFDKYVEKVRALGIDRATQIMQTALERYNSRLAAGQIKVVVNGNPLKMDTDPIIDNGSVLIPVRFAIEALGGKVDWDEKARKVTAVKGDVEIIFKIGSPEVLVNNERKTLETAVMLLNDRTYVPAEFLGETLGVKVDWDEKTKTVTIFSQV